MKNSLDEIIKWWSGIPSEIGKQKARLLIRGSFLGGFSGFTFLFSGLFNWATVAWEVPLKLFTTLIFTAASGLITLLVTDYYNFVIKKKLFKKKRDDKQQDDEKRA